MGVLDVGQNEESALGFWRNFHGPNKGYIEEQYDLYKEDPGTVDVSIKNIFDQYGAPVWLEQQENVKQEGQQTGSFNAKKLTSAMKLVEAIRHFGHLEADIYAVGLHEERKTELVDPKTYGLTEDDLKDLPASWLWEHAASDVENGLDVVNTLKKYYTGTMAFEFGHVNDVEELDWLTNEIESGKARMALTDEEKTQLLERLTQVEGFEAFLQKTFVGQKRFSIEGLEAMVPMLDHIVKYAVDDEVANVMIGMAHRGRLSVLAYVLGKPLDIIFSEFHHSPNKELIPSEGSKGINYGWSGDVKYHFGGKKNVKYSDEKSTKVTMAHNPSHLEFVNPVVEGFARAAQDDRTKAGYPGQNKNKAIPVMIHGDAAFIGEGIVAETFNLSNLPGYNTGGSVHIIANNLVGYTTDQRDGRSTRYASDLAKGFEVPIMHVNADDPVACVSAIRIAYDYRQKFNKDILIDLVGYRRYGHNEMDEPRMTQPVLYQKIDEHPTVSHVFAERLMKQEVINEETFKQMQHDTEKHLKEVYESMKEDDSGEPDIKEMPEELKSGLDQFETAVPYETLKALNDGLYERPEHINVKKLNRVLNRREKMLDEGNKIDWGAGEALTYATILKDGTPIRLTGQDAERGTFAHRHAVWNDWDTNQKYVPLQELKESKASFDIRNSPLSEAGVLGFEYGYSVHSSETLVIWEAQFGDFANAAQVIFDQFISSARAKWGDKSNMVMLLPHGYEGQGPEHSSARLERFLEMSAENNWIVAYVTSSAQFFHLLRRQAALGGREEARPLVLMTPKSSLLRNERVASAAEEFSDGQFQPLRNQPNLQVSKKHAKRLLLGSGKVMIDIENDIENSSESFGWLRALRVEQLYPFPEKELADELKQLPNIEEIVWVQEEPRNMGAWNFVKEKLVNLLQDGQTLRYVGRPERSSPAVGEPNIHKVEQDQLLGEAINPTLGGNTDERN